MTSGEVVSLAFDDAVHEQVYVTKEIKRLIDLGSSPESIAVIARNHKQLEALSPILAAHNIPVTYERETNVLDKPHIAQLVTCLRFIGSLADNLTNPDQSLLPMIVQYPFWGAERQEVWRLALAARKTDGGWLSAMLESDQQIFQQIAQLFLALAGKAQREPVERIIDVLVGGTSVALSSQENTSFRPKSEAVTKDAVDKSHTQASTMRSLDSLAVARDDVEGNAGSMFVSPFRQYYFGTDRYNEHRAEYLTFLSSLRTFIDTIRSYRRDMTRPALLADAIRALDIYEEHGVAMHDTSALRSGTSAVTLLTAHKAKGLEYDIVFVLSCQEDVWAKSKRGSNLPLPQNLHISPAGDSRDDMLRLFFVAITRAKRRLYMTHYESENGKRSSRLSFLEHQSLADMGTTAKKEMIAEEDMLVAVEIQVSDAPLVLATEEKALLLPFVEEYVMPVTHINNFLDVYRGGPAHFLTTNLLRFPQPMGAKAVYGTAMHAAAEYVTLQKKHGSHVNLEETLVHFEQKLLKGGLDIDEFNKYKEEGQRVLGVYHPYLLEHTSEQDHVELDFSAQGVLIGNAHITGKIDRLVTNDHSATVFDIKTGKAHREWKPHSDIQKIQFHNYKRQLTFYKLLIERSRDYSNLSVDTGVIEFASLDGADEIICLPYQITDEDVSRLEALIRVVYNKITNLDFPDISTYDQTYTGMLKFEDDLLSGAC